MTEPQRVTIYSAAYNRSPGASHRLLRQAAQLYAPGLGAGDFDDGGDDAATVGQARLLDDEVDGRGDLLADRGQRQVHAGHQHQGLEAGERVARAVGVQRGE